MFDLLSKGNLLAILRNEEKWEMLIILNNDLEIKRFVYEKSIYRLLKELSKYYHRCYKEEQRLIGNEYGIRQKVPILINPNKIMLFQTKSLSDPQCILLNYYCIYKYKKIEKSTLVEYCIPYKNNKMILNEEILIPCDRRTIHNQFKRCLEIDNTLRDRNII